MTAQTGRSVAVFHSREATTGKAWMLMVERWVHQMTSDDDVVWLRVKRVDLLDASACGS